MNLSEIKSVLLVLAIGDAVGVQYEFRSREIMLKNPATDMVGFGTYNQSPGTFSDESFLAFVSVLN